MQAVIARDIVLWGSLRKTYGERFRLYVTSLSEAVQLLAAQLPGFRQAIEEGHFKVTHRRGGRIVKYLDEERIRQGLGEGDIHITPMIAGAKNAKAGGVVKIIAGVVIAAVAFWAGQPQIAFMGLGLAVSGVSSLLTSTKRKHERKSDFSEGAQVAAQGDCVPLAYGQCMITPRCISAGVTTSDSNGYGIAVGTGQYVGQVGNSTARK